jgi:hypothetical protein
MKWKYFNGKSEETLKNVQVKPAVQLLPGLDISNNANNTSTRDEVFLDQQRYVLLYFGLDVFGQFEARIPEFDAMFSVHSTG